MFQQSLTSKVLIDAFTRALLLTVLSDLLLSGYAVEAPILGVVIIILCVLSSIISAWHFCRPEKNNRRILKFALFSFLLWLLMWFGLLLLSIVFSLRLFPATYMSNASPALFLMITPYVLLSSALLRLFLLLFFIFRNTAKTNKQAADNTGA